MIGEGPWIGSVKYRARDGNRKVEMDGRDNP